MDKISWGVISTANIGLAKVIPAMQKGQYSTIDAISSRDINRAREEAQKLKIPRFYGSYEELLADESIQAVYIPLPNHLHVKWILEALKAGKHVLCEKPLTMNYRDALDLYEEIKKYPDLKVMEAFMYRHHPQIIQTKKVIVEGKIGAIRNMHAVFTYFNDDPVNIRNMADIGGGGLLDIGCYCISIIRYFFGEEPKRVSAFIDFDPRMKIDRLVSATLEFKAGTATFTCSTQLPDHRYVLTFGTKGKIELPNPFVPQADEKAIINYTYDFNKLEQQVIEPVDQYTIQGDLFSRSIIDGTEVPTPIEDALANMKVIDAVFESAKKNRIIELK